ncbi:MAG TPA: helix-turn-helix transcriptional regulator [Rhizomicrobium sp.]|nr:helix-turn-helix transcriptional regulator [Rhizomicrobium sp.]
MNRAEVEHARASPKRTTSKDVKLGVRLRRLRILRGVSQTELGARLGGLTFQQIQKYESGANRISATRLYEIAVLLKVPITYFFEELPPTVLEPIDNEVRTLAKSMTAISDPVLRRKVIRLIETVAKRH